MTPGARIAAAIDVLDAMQDGQAAEQALTRWARRSRFAGSKDRAAVRDHVYDVLRVKRMAAHAGNGETSRALMIGLMRHQGADLDALFNGEGHAPDPLADLEQRSPAASTDQGVLWNLPDWLLDEFTNSLGAKAAETAAALQERAPITLRINLAKATPAKAVQALENDGVLVEQNPICDTAFTVSDGARRLRGGTAYRDGLVELQDAASQAVAAALPAGRRVLDFCAGGGGKSLAIAAQDGREVFAYDSDATRMKDLPDRAARAGVSVHRIGAQNLETSGKFDVVLCDAPCSGSGAWRRAPEGKWVLTPTRLAELAALQDTILDRAARLLKPGGTLAYATCSVLRLENEARVEAFVERTPEWRKSYEKRLDVDQNGDGFYTAHLLRAR